MNRKTQKIPATCLKKLDRQLSFGCQQDQRDHAIIIVSDQASLIKQAFKKHISKRK